MAFADAGIPIAVYRQNTVFRYDQLLQNRQSKDSGCRPVHFGCHQTAQGQNGIWRRAHYRAGGDALVYQLEQDGAAGGGSTQFTNNQHPVGNGLADVRLPWISYQCIRCRDATPKTDGLSQMQYASSDATRWRRRDQYFQLEFCGTHRSCSRPATALSTQS